LFNFLSSALFYSHPSPQLIIMSYFSFFAFSLHLYEANVNVHVNTLITHCRRRLQLSLKDGFQVDTQSHYIQVQCPCPYCQWCYHNAVRLPCCSLEDAPGLRSVVRATGDVREARVAVGMCSQWCLELNWRYIPGMLAVPQPQ